MVLAEDETDLLLFPVLRAAWARRGEPTEVLLSGRNARRIIFGAMNLRTGKRLFLARQRNRKEDFQEFLRLIRRHYRGWHATLLLDENPSHTPKRAKELSREFGVHFLWLPKRSPELNPMDTLWGKAKDAVSANLQRGTILDHVQRFLEYLTHLSDYQALSLSGVFSENFWLQDVL